MRIALIACAIAVAVCAPTAEGVTYTGSLTSMGGGLVGNGVWNSNSQNLPTTLTWTVDDTTTAGLWHYNYHLEVPLINHRKDEFKFLRLELSTGLQGVSNFEGTNAFTGTELDRIGTLKTTAGQPESFYGMQVVHPERLDIGEGGLEGHIVDIAFDSDRAPTWGDVYVRGYSNNRVRNEGFTKSDIDPTAAPADGSLDSHLLVPDTLSPPTPPDPLDPPTPPTPGVIPEPISLLLLGLALVPVGVKIRRRLTH